MSRPPFLFLQTIAYFKFAVFACVIYPPADCANAVAGCPSSTANASFFGISANVRQTSSIDEG